MAGAGPLAELLADPAVTDIVVNGPAEVWVDRGAGMVRAAVGFGDADSAAPVRPAPGRGVRPPARRRQPVRRRPAARRHPAARGAAAGRGPRARTCRCARSGSGRSTSTSWSGRGTLTADVGPAGRRDRAGPAGLRGHRRYRVGQDDPARPRCSGWCRPHERIVVVEDADRAAARPPARGGAAGATVQCGGRGRGRPAGSGPAGAADAPGPAGGRRVPGRRGGGPARRAQHRPRGRRRHAAREHGRRRAGPVRGARACSAGCTRDALHAQLAAGLQVVLQLSRAGAPGGRWARSACSCCSAGGRRPGGAGLAPRHRAGPGSAAALARLLAARGVPPPAVLGAPMTALTVAASCCWSSGRAAVLRAALARRGGPAGGPCDRRLRAEPTGPGRGGRPSGRGRARAGPRPAGGAGGGGGGGYALGGPVAGAVLAAYAALGAVRAAAVAPAPATGGAPAVTSWTRSPASPPICGPAAGRPGRWRRSRRLVDRAAVVGGEAGVVAVRVGGAVGWPSPAAHRWPTCWSGWTRHLRAVDRARATAAAQAAGARASAGAAGGACRWPGSASASADRRRPVAGAAADARSGPARLLAAVALQLAGLAWSARLARVEVAA